MKHSELFARAREEMAGRGLHKGSYFANRVGCMPVVPGPCCAIGAMIAATGLGDAQLTRAAVVFNAANKIHPSIVPWNDRPERTHLEVVVAFEKAHLYALELEARGELGDV
jgi:hypothetical protein